MAPPRNLIASFIAFIAIAFPLPATADAPEYQVGVAKRDITWHVNQDEPSASVLTFKGLHSRLWAKAIVVKPPTGDPFAFVRTDTLLITGDLYEGVTQRVQKAIGLAPERLLLAATHTHTGNNGLFPHAVHSGLYRSFDPREREFLADRIAEAVTDAYHAARPATLAVGSTSLAYTDFNRRYTDREQQNKPPFANDPSRLDPEIGVIRFDDARTRKPMAVLMNHGVHPVVTINEPLLSSDIVGFAERTVEERFRGAGKPPMAIWLTGAQGDQDPLHVRYDYDEAEWTGRALGRAAARVATDLEPAPIESAEIVDKLIPLPGPNGSPPSLGVEGVGRVPVLAPQSVTVPSSVRLQVIELRSRAGGRTALMTWPGEPIRDIGVSLKQHAKELGFDHAYVLGLANDWAGYWLTPAEYDRQMYEWTLMFYGRESSQWVEENVRDLVKVLATGGKPEAVPLPPQAEADRATTAAIAAAGIGGGDPEVVPPDPEPATLEQPAGALSRGGIVRFIWQGGSPWVKADWFPHVLVERRDGTAWGPVAREGTGDVLLRHEGDSRWSARWQPTMDAVTGTYRLRVSGARQTGDGLASYELTSQPFELDACRCLTGGAVRSAAGRTGLRLSVTVEYPVGPKDSFRLLPTRVANGHAVVAVLRDGREIGRVRLRYVPRRMTTARRVTVHDLSGRDLPVTTHELLDRGSFRGVWRGPRGVSFRLVAAEDRWSNSLP